MSTILIAAGTFSMVVGVIVIGFIGLGALLVAADFIGRRIQ